MFIKIVLKIISIIIFFYGVVELFNSNYPSLAMLLVLAGYFAMCDDALAKMVLSIFDITDLFG